MLTSETVRRWMCDGKLPAPDVNLSCRTKAGERLPCAAGIHLF